MYVSIQSISIQDKRQVPIEIWFMQTSVYQQRGLYTLPNQYKTAMYSITLSICQGIFHFQKQYKHQKKISNGVPMFMLIIKINLRKSLKLLKLLHR